MRVDLDELQNKASKVATMHADANEARKTVHDATVALLQAILLAAQPAAAALASRIPRCRAPGSQSEEHFEKLRGCVIGRHHTSPDSFELLTMTQFGKLHILSYKQLPEGGYQCVSYAPSLVAWDQLAEHYDAAELAITLVRKLNEQLRGKATKRARQMRKQAERLRAVATLLETER